MKFSWNQVFLGSTLAALGLMANSAIAAPSESGIDESTVDLSTLSSDASVFESADVAAEISTELETDLIADSSIANFGQQSYHLDSLISAPSTQDQVTSVSQLSDVLPTDWAFQAVQSLVERYGCIAGYPDGTFRGNRKATRYEMAAALNACLDNISDRFASQEDLETVRALQSEFAAELATLRGRVDGLEARTATLEAQQFSTTTKLKGEAVFTLSGAVGDFQDGIANGPNVDTRVSLTQRTRLTFLSSFSGRDRLFLRLQSQNRQINFGDTVPGDGPTPLPNDVIGTNASRLSIDTGNSNGTFTLDRLDYKFPIGDNIDVTAFSNAAFHHYYATTTNPSFEGFGGSAGAVSWFGERNPIYRNGTVGVSSRGIGTTLKAGRIRFDAGYFANAADSPVAVINPVTGGDEGGLFGGGYSALGQATLDFDKGAVTATFVRTEDPAGLVRNFAGTLNSNNPFPGSEIATNSVALQAYVDLTDNITVAGWGGYTFADDPNGPDNAEILNAAINIAFKDVGVEGGKVGLIFGVPPFVVNNTIAAENDTATPFHIEALYEIPVNNNITITPGVFYLINPNGNSVDEDVFVGALRTTFKF